MSAIRITGQMQAKVLSTFAKQSERVAFSVPFPTPLPFPQTCSQPWVGLEFPEYLRAFR
jgi:hypothetical protein